MQPPGEGNYCASYERLHVNVCSSCCQQQVSTHLTYQAFYSPSFICFHHPLTCALVFINGFGFFSVCIGFLFLFFPPFSKEARVHVFDGAFGWWPQLLLAAFPLLCGGLRGTIWKMLFLSHSHMVGSDWALVSYSDPR